jgi:NAD(P)-dependent dehydrogenase (short-subunit alcohol dehydrogenase family)
MTDLTRTIPFVTGANRGIGRALVEAFLAAGVPRVYAGARDPSSLGHLTGAADVRVVPIALDVTDPAAIRAAAWAATDATVLVNNAGILAGSPLIAAQDPDAAEREIQVNYLGPLRLARAFAPILAHNGGGAIVNVLSILARVSMPRIGSYSASKAAALSMTQGIRGELAPQNTRVIAVLPAFVDTDMASKVPGPKLTPAQVATAVLDALRGDADEVYPGPAADIARALQADPRAVEQQFAAMFR